MLIWMRTERKVRITREGVDEGEDEEEKGERCGLKQGFRHKDEVEKFN